jgi:hypothetical protein
MFRIQTRKSYISQGELNDGWIDLRIQIELIKDILIPFMTRWKYCANIVNDGFGMAVAYLYVQEHYANTTEFKIKQMIHYLKRAFEHVVLEQDWLSDDFKQDVIDKVSSLLIDKQYFSRKGMLLSHEIVISLLPFLCR